MKRQDRELNPDQIAHAFKKENNVGHSRPMSAMG
jgi:hypothetical protein